MKKKISLIYLTGFMGSGKSTFAPIIANSIGWDYFDSDKMIEEVTGESINSLFRSKGELYFRKIETETIEHLSQAKRTVISLGGGAILNHKNFDLISTSGILVYLKVSPEVIYQRLKHKGDRPLLLDSDNQYLPEQEVVSRINKLLIQREPYYLKADIVFEAESFSIGKSADILMKILYSNYIL